MPTLEIEAIYIVLAPTRGTLRLKVRTCIAKPYLFPKGSMYLSLALPTHFLLFV